MHADADDGYGKGWKQQHLQNYLVLLYSIPGTIKQQAAPKSTFMHTHTYIYTRSSPRGKDALR